LRGKKPLRGYLDRLRENLDTLDEQIKSARKMSKKKGKDSNALQWAKTLRDLVELRDRALVNIKVHLLGRDESGAATEPPEYYLGNANAEVMFERDFQAFLAPWTREDLKLKCEDCGAESESVISQSFEEQVSLGVGDMMTTETEYRDLCSRCYEKRTAKEGDEPGKAEDGDSDSSGGDPLEKIDLSKLAPEAVAVIRKLQETRKQLLGTKEAGQPGSS
jgi:hypothetical protein